MALKVKLNIIPFACDGRNRDATRLGPRVAALQRPELMPKARFASALERGNPGTRDARVVPAANGLAAVISPFKMTGVAKPYALGIYREPLPPHGRTPEHRQNQIVIPLKLNARPSS